MKCGLLGRKLGHSYSPQIHSHLGNYSYLLFEKEPQELEAFLKESDFAGLNVTIPYKKDVIPFLDELSPVALRMGAVNTIVRKSDGALVGHNTDYFGFSSMVSQSGLCPKGKKCLVLGSGGASNTAVTVLREMGGEVIVVSRTGENNYQNLGRHADASILVNATPVGMYPENSISPVSPEQFPNLEGILDLIYNPARTKLLMDAAERGLIAMNGLWMLVAQAKESAEWFTGEKISDSIISRIHRTLQLQMENIVLIGMPGCGKSTVGELLARKLGKQFVDADAALEEACGRKIADIIPTDGEEVFRRLETDALSVLGKKSGLVIATGGGCVTQEHNYPLLHQNGSIFWLQRSLDALPTDGRPLSQLNSPKKLYQIRKPMYTRFADFTVSNDSTPEMTVSQILAILEGSHENSGT